MIATANKGIDDINIEPDIIYNINIPDNIPINTNIAGTNFESGLLQIKSLPVSYIAAIKKTLIDKIPKPDMLTNNIVRGIMIIIPWLVDINQNHT